MQNILEISKVHQKYRTGFWMSQTHVLKGVSFSVPRRSIFGLLGANGAGKTTLIKIIVGLNDPKSGSITINGIQTYSPEARIRIGYMPERPYFHEFLTGQELLYYMGELSGMSRLQVSKKIDEVLDMVGMRHAKNLELGKYSKGMLQRIGIAQSILHDPELLVLDEPMSGLDPMGRQEMRDLILKLADSGKTVFFTSHLIQDVEAICHSIAILKRGELFGCGPVSEFIDEENEEVEILVNNISAQALSNLEKVEEVAGGVKITVPAKSDINTIVKRVMEKDAKIISIVPTREHLEQMFIRSNAED